MKFIHTSDWHLGHKLYGRSRHPEHEAFLSWLATVMDEQKTEVLLIAGDVFDTQTPSNKTLSIYYRFLSQISSSGCRHVVIIGGNHDSPSLLNGPRELLGFLNIHVIGQITITPADEVLVLNNRDNQPGLMVLAVPYLRDKDVRSSKAGESLEEKNSNLLNGIYDHYQKVYDHALNRQAELTSPIPIVTMGHLFCKGGETIQGDGLRELYVGSLAHVNATAFADTTDYLALGHLHQMQTVGGKENRRYSGSPLQMNFNEADSDKYILQVVCDGYTRIKEIPVPRFHRLATIRGNMEEILSKIRSLHEKDVPILLEIHYTGKALADDLQEQIYSAVADTRLEVLRINNRQIYDHILQQTETIQELDELRPQQVFQQCLDLHRITPEQQKEMVLGFKTAMAALYDTELGD